MDPQLASQVAEDPQQQEIFSACAQLERAFSDEEVAQNTEAVLAIDSYSSGKKTFYVIHRLSFHGYKIRKLCPGGLVRCRC